MVVVGVLHDDNDNADVTPYGRPDFVALGLNNAALSAFAPKRQIQGDHLT